MLISDFARLGQVTVRMLRHYDAIGLLVPDHVDPSSGYRSYDPEQLHDLNRIVALKDLGFSLEQVRSLLQEPVGADELRGMLRLRRAELLEEARAVDTRLNAVESRLRMIEQEDTVPDYVVKTIPAVRLVAQSRTMQREEIGQHLEAMFQAVASAIGDVRGAFDTPIATYEEVEDGLRVVGPAGHPVTLREVAGAFGVPAHDVDDVGVRRPEDGGRRLHLGDVAHADDAPADHGGHAAHPTARRSPGRSGCDPGREAAAPAARCRRGVAQ